MRNLALAGLMSVFLLSACGGGESSATTESRLQNVETAQHLLTSGEYQPLTDSSK